MPKINGNTFSLTTAEPAQTANTALASQTPVEPLPSGLIYLAASCSLGKSQKEALRGLGAYIEQYLGDNYYSYYWAPVDKNATAQLRALPFVEAVEHSNSRPELKIHDNIKDIEGKVDVCVVLDEKHDSSPEKIKEEIVEKTEVKPEDITVDVGRLRLTVQPGQLNKLAEIDSIKTIEADLKPVVFNNMASKAMNANDVVCGNKGPYKGKGQTVAVADTGLDNGCVDNIHPAFTGRVSMLMPISRKIEARCDDTNGHGTHVAGSVLGAHIPNTRGDDAHGIAPEANLVFLSCQSSSNSGAIEYKSVGISNLFVIPHKGYEAYIHTNSWGTPWDKIKPQLSAYSKDKSEKIDETVYDNPELLILFAAGNHGAESQGPTLGTEAAAKNCLTVGATNSPRKNGPNGVAYFSSRGPTLEKRIKPDVLAPGVSILSARSRAADAENCNTYKENDFYQWKDGTSMATPLVAGCAAVLREALIDNGCKKPTAALLKALLINGAHDFRSAPVATEDFGLVNLQDTINQIQDPTFPNAGYRINRLDEPDNLPVSKEFSFSIQEPDSAIHESQKPNAPYAPGQGMTLKVTLAYTDRPGEHLQNDLSLLVKTVSDGAYRYGNRGKLYTGPYKGKLEDVEEDSDDKNNVEQVVWKNIPAGQVEIKVLGKRFTSDSQEYAVVWRVFKDEVEAKLKEESG